MSCQIKLTANICDIPAIRRCLFPTDDSRGTDAWLQFCEISASPTGDVIAIANSRKLVILTAKWDSSSSLSQFQITYSGTIHESDNITAVLCLPIVGQGQNTHVGPDWTCIVVGYESGNVRFYTENCDLLLEEQFHNENVASIKCQSQHSPRPDISPTLHQEEVYVHYLSNVCVVPGNQLFSSLRNCRSQLARVQAKGDLIDLNQAPLNVRKWGFQDQTSISDMEVVGLNLASTFDHLMTASMCGGYDTKYRTMPPHNTLVMAAGSKPFLGFHYALEGGAQPMLSDVAKAVATKLKSALPGWLTGSKSQVEKQVTTAMQPSEPMGCRFGLCDLRRTASKIILSPDRKLAAVSDGLGRVLLVDTFRGITVHIFKGYRDAQCSFIQVPDERKSKHRIGNKVALFLIIYSPKKGTLEIFTTQQGIKVTTFTASKFSQLFYISYGLMGFTTTSKSRYVCQFTTIFIDNDGQIKEFLIPFHYSLPEKNNKRSRDIHLYKKLRQLIKSDCYDVDKIADETYKTCTELKTTEIKCQLIESLTNNKTIPAEITLKCANYFVENFNQEETIEPETCNLKVLCENLKLLLHFYLFVENNLDAQNGNASQESNVKISSLINDSKTKLNLDDLGNLQKLLDLSTLSDNRKSSDVKVTFTDEHDFTVSDLIACFELSDPNCIKLKQNTDELKLFKASESLFKNYVSADIINNNYNELTEEIVRSKILIKDLFSLLVNYWVNRSLKVKLNLESEMSNFSLVVLALVKAANPEEVIVEYNSTSKFWSEIREILANSSRPFPALTAAILCRNVAHKIESEKELLQQSSTSLEDEIEMLSQENCQWSLLIGKLEDVSLLNIILNNKPVGGESVLPKLSHEKTDVSLKFILQKGKGSVSELVAKWLTSAGINPEDLFINDALYKLDLQSNSTNQTDTSSSDLSILMENVPEEKLEEIKKQLVFEHLNLIKAQFPYSLEVSTLLANISWEYALAWKRDIQDLNYLEASIKCLKCIPSAHVQQGLYNLLWNTHLKIIFESSCKLINKVGKLPKERLCRQDTGLTDYQIALFMEICTEFLDSFMDAVQQSCNAPKVTPNYEPIFENGGVPLVELTLQQNNTNYDLLHLHYQLSLTIQMITTFSVKHNKPVNNLFESSMSALFYSDFQKQLQINLNKSDSKLNNSRVQFLLKVISASLESVTLGENNKVYSSEHVRWMSKCLSIARLWNLDLDLFKRYQVVQLYSNGFDTLASELFPAVNDRAALGVELLGVSGKRLSHYLANTEGLAENISALSPALTEYLNTLNGDYCAPSKLESILALTTVLLTCLEENQSEHKIAVHLIEACTILLELQS